MRRQRVASLPIVVLAPLDGGLDGARRKAEAAHEADLRRQRPEVDFVAPTLKLLERRHERVELPA